VDSYKILWKRSAEKDLERIEPKHVLRIIEVVESLSVNPFPPDCRKLRGVERIYRIRVGDYRVIYQVDIKAKIVVIYYVRHRRKAYRGIF